MEDNYFDDIRPYNDEEMREVVGAMLKNPELSNVASKYLTFVSFEDLVAQLRTVKTVEELQTKIMYPAVESIIKSTSDGFIAEGLENFADTDNILFISNHRDIVLDATILQYILKGNNHATSEIAVGDNLLHNPVYYNIMRMNKMIITKRSDSIHEKLKNAIHLSEYVRHSIVEKGNSVWISQRNGRTKDGSDSTDAGLINMLNISGKRSFTENMNELNIVPLSISYQYEPCDFLKTHEVMMSRRDKYVKRQNEDYNSIKQGILQKKGKIIFTFSPKVKIEQNDFDLPKNEQCRKFASIIDKQIRGAYRFWDTNYYAFDILKHGNNFPEDKVRDFIDYMNEGLAAVGITKDDYDEARDIFLHIYANPIINSMRK